MITNSDVNDLEFKGDNPGAVKYGNFINYYKFHPPENRISVFPTNLWNITYEKCLCLDIGCNSGDLTNILLGYVKQNVCKNECYIFGIDIDPVLIQRANDSKTQFLQFECLDFMNNAHYSLINNYLERFVKTKFDIAFCFSVTMWIHLNHGDDGLKTFLEKVCNSCDKLIIEPQPWKCYKSAVKRMKLANYSFPLFKQLKIRQNVEQFIKQILENNCNFVKIYESDLTSWGRKILFYERNLQKIQ